MMGVLGYQCISLIYMMDDGVLGYQTGDPQNYYSVKHYYYYIQRHSKLIFLLRALQLGLCSLPWV